MFATTLLITWELRRQLYGRYRSTHNRSRSRSMSSYRHRSHEDHYHRSSRQYDDEREQQYHESRNIRLRPIWKLREFEVVFGWRCLDEGFTGTTFRLTTDWFDQMLQPVGEV